MTILSLFTHPRVNLNHGWWKGRLFSKIVSSKITIKVVGYYLNSIFLVFWIHVIALCKENTLKCKWLFAENCHICTYCNLASRDQLLYKTRWRLASLTFKGIVYTKKEIPNPVVPNLYDLISSANLITKEDILISKLLRFHCTDKKCKSMGSEMVWLATLFKIYSFVFSRKKLMELHE